MAKDIIGTCNLCFENKVLIQGHIFPKWSSRLSGKGTQYHERTNDISSWPEDSLTDKSLKGPTAEYLFCLECDNSFGKGEAILREMIHPSRKKPSYISSTLVFPVELKGEIPIQQFFLALGGLLLKGHIAKEDGMWKKFYLNKKQRNLVFNGIKNSNLSQNIEVYIHKIYCLSDFKIGNFTDRMSDFHLLGDHPFDLQYAAKPRLVEHGKFTSILIFGGLLMTITFHPRGYINPNLSLESFKVPIYPLDMRYLLVQKEGIGLLNLAESSDYNKMRKYMAAIQKLPLDSKCPCFVPLTNDNGIKENLNFGNCCYKYWRFDYF